VLAYGNFIQTVFTFLVIAFTIFLVVRQINRMRGTGPSAA
jgi:large-conductance mechanosensitive channel